MKNIIILICLLSGLSIYAQRKPKIKGNKNVTQIREDLPPFNAIELIDDLEINLKSSRLESYIVEADDNLMDVLKFKVIDSTLIITSFYNITSKKKLDITVNYNVLNAITLKSGKMITDVVSTDNLYLNLFEDSVLELNTSAAFVAISMEGNSFGNFNLDSDSLNISLKDRVDARIYAVSESNHIRMDKDTKAQLEGTTDKLQVTLLGDSDFRGQKLEAATVSAKLEESATAKIYAFKDFELSSKGSSKTYLFGNPTIVVTEFLDTSELHKEKD
ncbi:GIN domain-containing protein [Costertonia aggregata]|uniref:DUF2807 domain-containing protein n=1 Tax=Costertonia aggregata TaxID=343403 RepID=A0A7H9AMP7_9FLAO|nr:DUF2807 domain-containing protein [Costertonia aggregata]QLG44555.1 DUF2807 domain-containing protein [Costertonia aggregata]